MICLDTNVVIAFLAGKPATLVARVENELLQGRTLALPAVALFELHHGAAKSARREKNRDRLSILLQLPVSVLPSNRKTQRRQATSAPIYPSPAGLSAPTTS